MHINLPKSPLLTVWIGTTIALGGAWYIEYGLHVQPCELCLLQRWPYYIILLLIPTLHIFKVSNSIQYITAICILLSSIVLGGYHSGVERGIFEGFTSCSAQIDPLDTQKLMELLNQSDAILTRCDGIYFTILSLSLANWNTILSAIAAIYLLCYSQLLKRAG